MKRHKSKHELTLEILYKIKTKLALSKRKAHCQLSQEISIPKESTHIATKTNANNASR
jgi:hypothetical protein